MKGDQESIEEMDPNNNQKKKKKAKKGKKKNAQVAPMSTAMVPYRAMRGGGQFQAGSQLAVIASNAKSHLTMCNPFDARKSLGCRYPDGNASMSLPIQIRGIDAISTIAASANALAIYGLGYPYNRILGTALGATWTLAGTATAAIANSTLTTLIANGGTLRPVCAGLIIRCSQSAMNASGTVVISKIPGQVVAGSTSFPHASMYGEVRAFPIYAGMEVCVLFKPEGADAFNFGPVNTAAGFENPWDYIAIEIISGSGTATAVLSVEYISNVEVCFNSDNIAYEMFSRPTVENPLVVSTVKKVWSSIGSVIEGGVQVASRLLMNAATQKLSSVLGIAKVAKTIVDVD